MSATGTITVRFSLGAEIVTRFPADDFDLGGWAEPAIEHRPNMVSVERVLTIWFGEGKRAPRRTKRLRGVHRFECDDPVPERAWLASEERARREMEVVVERHGLDAEATS